jgi:short-subunit dehydrogenase
VNDTDGQSRRNDTSGDVLVVFGGRSEIGIEVARRLARGATVVLAARRPQELDSQFAELHRAGAISVHAVAFDADDLKSHRAVVDSIVADHGRIDTAVLAFGILGDQSRAETDAAHAAAIAHTDYVAQVSLLTVLIATMREAGSGTVVAFSSIAGVRARRANYVYGSAKAGLDAFCSGLSDALRGSGVRLLLVRPGFVIGRMTAGMTPAPLATTPGKVADATVAALRKGRGTVWVPAPLSVLAFGFRMTPRAVWRRLWR